MNLHAWSWLFLVLYIVAMTGFGYVGSRRVSGADDYATARAGYGFCRDISWADCGAGNSAVFWVTEPLPEAHLIQISGALSGRT